MAVASPDQYRRDQHRPSWGAAHGSQDRDLRTDQGGYCFRLLTKDGELVATGEPQKSRTKARESVLALLKAVPKAKIYDLTETSPIS